LNRVLCIFPGQPEERSFYLCFLCHWNDGYSHRTQHFTGWDGVLLTFLPRLASNLDHPKLYLLSSWDYKHEPWLLATYFFFVKPSYPLHWYPKQIHFFQMTDLKGNHRHWPIPCESQWLQIIVPKIWLPKLSANVILRPGHHGTEVV
jgi:hypothetical protein